jgi:hypothetical protein
MKIVILNERSLSPEPARESEETLNLWKAAVSGMIQLRKLESQHDIFLSKPKLAHGVS